MQATAQPDTTPQAPTLRALALLLMLLDPVTECTSPRP